MSKLPAKCAQCIDMSVIALKARRNRGIAPACMKYEREWYWPHLVEWCPRLRRIAEKMLRKDVEEVRRLFQEKLKKT